MCSAESIDRTNAANIRRNVESNADVGAVLWLHTPTISETSSSPGTVDALNRIIDKTLA